MVYVLFIILQLFLFNFVILGIFLYVISLGLQFTKGIYRNKIYTYKNKPFENFVKAENSKFKQFKIDLVAGKEGWWIEIKLPNDKTDELDSMD